MRKPCGGWGKKGVLVFFGLFYFRDVVQSTKYWQAQYMSSPPRVTCPWPDTPLTYHVSFLKLFQSTEPNLISGRRQKGGWANGCHSIFCKKPVSLCLSVQERLITTTINIRVRIWVLQWEGRKKRKPPHTPVKSFINFLVLTVSKNGVLFAI